MGRAYSESVISYILRVKVMHERTPRFSPPLPPSAFLGEIFALIRVLVWCILGLLERIVILSRFTPRLALV